ncbi:MAG: hypothetical protein HN712_11540 [Gemmatimonadetes bacterium]|nr:hypothetical protein [Gemmatimonadota bacterium]MBT7860941.1 hypothetical protein [Gemmatimonadota bacterium]
MGVWGAGGAWGYDQASGLGGVTLGISVPLTTVITWTAFAVPGGAAFDRGGLSDDSPRIATEQSSQRRTM